MPVHLVSTVRVVVDPHGSPLPRVQDDQDDRVADHPAALGQEPDHKLGVAGELEPVARGWQGGARVLAESAPSSRLKSLGVSAGRIGNAEATLSALVTIATVRRSPSGGGWSTLCRSGSSCPLASASRAEARERQPRAGLHGRARRPQQREPGQRRGKGEEEHPLRCHAVRQHAAGVRRGWATPTSIRRCATPHHKSRADDARLLSHAFRANGDAADGGSRCGSGRSRSRPAPGEGPCAADGGRAGGVGRAYFFAASK